MNDACAEQRRSRVWLEIDLALLRANFHKIREAVARMSPAERNRVLRANQSQIGAESGITQEEVREILRSPQRHLMLPQIAAMLPALRSMNMARFHTDDALGFITSDAPVIIGDPKHNPAWLSGVRLMSPTVEIYLPIAPSLCAVLQRTGTSGIHPADKSFVDEVNRIIRFSCHESYVARRNATDPYWFSEEPRG